MTSPTGHNADAPKGPSARRGGFTLLELILVLVLISTVLAMAAPSLRGFATGRKVQDAAAQILALTRLAAAQGAAEARVYRLNLNTKEGTYWLTAEQAGGFAELGRESGRQFELPAAVRMELDIPLAQGQGQSRGQGQGQGQADESYIHFYPDGRNDQGRIILIDQTDQAVEVTSPSSSERFRIISPAEDRR